MKCTIPEISWHNREPVLSVDIFPESASSYRLASGGGDCHVLIWQMSIAQNGAVNQELVSDLTRHQKAVNCVRWSPSGKYLGTGDDDANIIIWNLKTDNIPLLEGDTEDKETWLIFKVMRGHKEDVYDICWSMDEAKILSGSVDNTAILWDVNKGKMDHILTDHKGFVQGVAWDPKNQCIATIGTDRICRIFDCKGKQVKARIQKGKLTRVPENHCLKDKEVKYFHDDTFKSFFRRLQFTPDGSLLIVPSGHLEVESTKTYNATLVFTLDNFTSPAIILPIPHQSSTVVRCNPTLYELRETGPPPCVKLPYRMIFAVGTDRDIILYDTQQTLPIARFQDIHYTRLTDITWSHDGLLLIASSTDGFCSLITFDMDELGVPWTKVESEEEDNPLEISGCEELPEKDENVDINNKEVKKEEGKKRSSFLEQWALKTPKKRKVDEGKTAKLASPCVNREVNVLIPRRVETKQEQPGTSKEEGESCEDEKKENGDSGVELTVEEIKDYQEASKGIKELFNRHPKPTTSSTPEKKEKINVLIPKRKPSCPITPNKAVPRIIESTNAKIHINPLDNVKLVAHNITDGDKSEDIELNKKASSDIKAFFSRKPDKVDNSGEAKPIAVRRRPKHEDKDAKPPPIVPINCKNEEANKIITIDSDEYQHAKSKDVKKLKTDKIIVTGKGHAKDSAKANKNQKDCDKEDGGTTPKKPKPTKIKVSSLIATKRKSTDVTPKKPNALLNFLHKSSEQDTKKRKPEDDRKDVITIDDDETEDFCLQLEESQDGCVEEESQLQTKAAPKTPRRVPLITLASPSSKTKKKL